MANNGNKKSLFWTSYSDLMTSLFFAMLVLFVVVVVAMGSVNKRLAEERDRAVASEAELAQILKLQDQFETLSKSTTLSYDNDKRMFYAKDFVGIEIFNQESDSIKLEYKPTVDKVGKDIVSILQKLQKNNPSFKYQLVIEGNAAIPYDKLRSKTYDPDSEYAYNLSYRRSLALYNRWKHLDFRKYNTEIIIAGSGFNGINRDKKNENNNKRFVIQIIPKIDKPSSKKNK